MTLCAGCGNGAAVGRLQLGDCRGVSLQVAVTSVIASYFPLQRKIVFIMCHAHSARQGPLESIPKSQREEALHLNSRLASNKKGEKEQREEVEEEEDRREGRGVEKTEEAHHKLCSNNSRQV